MFPLWGKFDAVLNNFAKVKQLLYSLGVSSKFINLKFTNLSYYLMFVFYSQIIFGEMIDLLYKPVDCDPSSEDCSSEYDSVADDMEHDSFVVSGWWALLILQVIAGYSLMFYGFGVASERLNRRIRYVIDFKCLKCSHQPVIFHLDFSSDATFISLIRQEVGFFDTLNASSLTSQLQNDVNL